MINFHLYGFLIGLGILIGIIVSEKAKERLANYSKEYNRFSVWLIFWWVVIPGLIGARLYHVIDFWEYYQKFPNKIYATWEGGMGIYGGIIGGIIGLGLYSLKVSWSEIKKKSRQRKIFHFLNCSRVNFLQTADIVVIGLPLGQAIGRLGNFFNQELYGLPTKLPWGIYIQPEKRLPGFEGFARFHPLFAYEAIWNIAIFMYLWFWLPKFAKKRLKGMLFLSYLFLYALGRFFLEFLRLNAWQKGGLTVAQWISLLIIGSASLILVIKKCRI